MSSRPTRATRAPRERVLVTGVRFTDMEGADPEEDLGEACGLVEAAEADVVGELVMQKKPRPEPATLFGSGKVNEIKALVDALHPDAVVIDNDLSPAQGRNLEKAWGVRIIDRSELILDIFARRARTRQARLQVELAQNEYIAPRLRRMWTHLERHEGAIGTRGPGETQLETDKRLLRKRIQDLKEELAEIEERKRREVKTRADLFTIGLVGYTNAGKSTLLNALTGADELVADMLFATLDTRTRQWRLSDGRTVLLSDTVGFLQRLPHHLVASFHATLEETLNADLLMHVVDASHSQAAVQMDAVEGVLESLSYHTHCGIVVLNKIDRVEDPIQLQSLVRDEHQDVVYVSAQEGTGLDRLDEVVRKRLDARSFLVDVRMAAHDGRLDSAVRSLSQPIEEEIDEESGEHRLRVRLTPGALGNLRRTAAKDVRFDVIQAPTEGRAREEAGESGSAAPPAAGEERGSRSRRRRAE
jgi:GTP-binding protein HflX